MFELFCPSWMLVTVATILFVYTLFWLVVHGFRRYVKSNVSLKGKTVVITGGNSGIGKETAVDLARRGALVILACRDMHKAEEAAHEIRVRSGNNDVIYRRLDLSSLESVRQFAKKFIEEKHRLDILINNAGIGRHPSMKTTEDGFDIVFGVNHFGHFLLTNLLLDKLKECAPSRVVTVSSRAERRASSKDFWSTCQERDGIKYPDLRAYHNSKAANIMFARQLARHLGDTDGVTSYSVEPGIAYTSIFASSFGPKLDWILRPFLWLLCTTETTGAQTTIFCAVDQNIAHLSGSFFGNCQLAKISSRVAADDDAAKRLWEVSRQAVGLGKTDVE